MQTESGRTEAFSDGIFAIAATLLVLNLTPRSDSNLLRGLLAEWPSYAAYGTSFLVIGIMWINHHALFTQINRVNRGLMFINLLLLLFIAVLPFPTVLVSRHLGDSGSHLAVAIYGLNAVAIGICFNGLWTYAVMSGMAVMPPGASAWRFALGLVVYTASVGVAFIDARLALAIIAAMAVYYAFDQTAAAKPRG